MFEQVQLGCFQQAGAPLEQERHAPIVDDLTNLSSEALNGKSKGQKNELVITLQLKSLG